MTKNYTHPLRAIREAHNLTIDELAEEVKVGAKTIWNAENNRPISAKCRRLICAYFGKTSQELELISAKRGGKIEQPLKTEFSVNLTAEYVPEVPLQDLRGRSLSFSPHIILDSSLLDRLAHTFNAPGKMDNATLGYLSTLVFEQKKQLVQGKGTNWYELLTTASNNLRLFMNFLESCPGTRQQLISIIGETCLLIGDVLFNAGDYQTAISYYTMSLHAAQESQNTTLQAIAFGRYCLLLIDHQQSSQALPFIDKAIRLAESDSSSVIRSWLWAVKGEAYASTREEKKCFKALETSMELLGRNEEKKVCYTFVEELAPSVYSTSKLLGYEGACYLRLKQSEQAQRVLLVSQKSSSHPHHQSFVSADFALALIQQKAPQDACIFAIQALNYIQQTHSTRAFQRVLLVRESLSPWNDISGVRDLDEQILLSRQLL